VEEEGVVMQTKNKKKKKAQVAFSSAMEGVFHQIFFHPKKKKNENGPRGGGHT